MPNNPYVIADGEVQVTRKVSYEVICVVADQPLAIGEFRTEADANAFAELVRKNKTNWRAE